MLDAELIFEWMKVRDSVQLATDIGIYISTSVFGFGKISLNKLSLKSLARITKCYKGLNISTKGGIRLTISG